VSDTLSGKTKGLAWLLKTISMQPLRKNLFSAPDSCCDSSRCSHGLSPVLSEQTHLRFLCFLLFERSHACLFPVSIHVDNPLFQHQKVLHGSGARSTKHEARSTKHEARSTKHKARSHGLSLSYSLTLVWPVSPPLAIIRKIPLPALVFPVATGLKYGSRSPA
jgi:hypothetical protein